MTLAICIPKQHDILINDLCIVSLIQYLSFKNVLNGKAFYSSAAAKHKTQTYTEQTVVLTKKITPTQKFSVYQHFLLRFTLQLSVAYVSFFNMWNHGTEADFQ